jgi:hypothetical protein
LLAESVHHLVGGNPLRAGLSADTIGRGEPVPERFDVVCTPRGGRALSWQVGALVAASWTSSATGWNSNRPRALVEPHVEALAESILGDASSWHIHSSVTVGGAITDVVTGLDTLQLCALDVICETSGKPSLLEARIADVVAAGQPEGAQIAPVTHRSADATLGLGELAEVCARLRTLFAVASPLGPQHVNGPSESPVTGFNTPELAARANGLQSHLSNAASQLSTAIARLQAAAGSDPGTLKAAVQGVRSALIAIADTGFPSAYPPPIDPDLTVAASLFAARGTAVMAAVTPLAVATPPAAPGGNASSTDLAQWFSATTDYVHSIVGALIPITACYQLPGNSPYAQSFGPGNAPPGSDETAVMMWLRRMARVRPSCQAVHDLLMTSEVLQAALPSVTVAQLPVTAGEHWVGLPFDTAATAPRARLSTVALTPGLVDVNGEFCGLLFDNWAEQLPGVTSVTSASSGYEAAEITGMSFTLETPEAYPPQSILLAIAPDQTAGWSLDILLDVVQETLELAKVRMVDLGDLFRLGRVLPALHTTNNVNTMLSEAGVKS